MIKMESPPEEYATYINQTNPMQVELMKRAPKDLQQRLDEWGTLFGKRFRYLIVNRASADSEFWEKIKDPVERAKVIDEIEHELYHEDDNLQLAA